MTKVSRVLAALAALFWSAGAALAAPASTSTGMPNALQGFSQNRGQPVQIEAASLEVRDKSGVATFSGNVKVVQGDTTMRCATLVVYYESSNSKGTMRSATPGPGGRQQISRLEAKGKVVVTKLDQTATGDTGQFDMKANTVTLLGNVVVSQGQNVMRGDRLVVDLTTGVSRVESSRQGPVRMLIHQQPGSRDQQQGGKPSGQDTPGSMIPRLGPRPFPSN